MLDIYRIVPRATRHIILDFNGTIADTHYIWPDLNRMWFAEIGAEDDPVEFDRLAANTTFEQASKLLLQRNP